jgi:hypothetical protein
MNTRFLLGMLAIGMLTASGTALAVGGDIAGLVMAEADASARADASGAFDAVHEAEDEAEAAIRQIVDDAAHTATQTKANAEYEVDYSMDQGTTASGEAKGGLLGGLAANLDAFGGWARSLWIRPSADVQHALDADGVIGAVGDATSQDGSLDVGAAENLEGAGRVDYNLPPPPQPELGFVQSVKIAFECLLAVA